MGKGCSGCGSYGAKGGYSGGLGTGSYGKPGKSYNPMAMAYANSLNQQNSYDWNPQSMAGKYPVVNFNKLNPVIYKEENESVNPFNKTTNQTSIIQVNTPPFSYAQIAGQHTRTNNTK